MHDKFSCKGLARLGYRVGFAGILEGKQFLRHQKRLSDNSAKKVGTVAPDQGGPWEGQIELFSLGKMGKMSALVTSWQPSCQAYDMGCSETCAYAPLGTGATLCPDSSH